MIRSIKKVSAGIMILLCTSAAFAIEMRWDWSKINVDDVNFDSSFIFGTAVAGHQVDGAKHHPNSNWARWENLKDKKGNPRILGDEKSGAACDFWNLYPQDIERMKYMKIKSFRCSIEWSTIEPQPGKINKDAIVHYHKMFDALIAAGIQPMVTLHHFTHPLWFEDIGAFEHEKNLHYFVDYCTLMVQEFGSKIMMWTTFNEPGVYVFQGYIRGVWPPGKIGMNRAMWVERNMLKAHVDAYQAIKEIAPKAQVGLVHSITYFDPYNDNFAERIPCYYLNLLFHDAITSFFETGEFKVAVPMLANIEYKNKAATKSLDYFGINPYSHVLLRVDSEMQGQAYREDEIRTDMPYCIYPEILYRTIADVSKRIAKPQGIPIYITENGIADNDDSRRELFIKRYIYALHKAKQDGYDVRGYFYWSLLDNFEWAEGYSMRFGLYKVNFATQERTLNQGAKAFVNIIHNTYAPGQNSVQRGGYTQHHSAQAAAAA